MTYGAASRTAPGNRTKRTACPPPAARSSSIASPPVTCFRPIHIVYVAPPGRHTYQFVSDGDRWLEDPSAEHHEADGFGGRAAVLVVD